MNSLLYAVNFSLDTIYLYSYSKFPRFTIALFLNIVDFYLYENYKNIFVIKTIEFLGHNHMHYIYYIVNIKPLRFKKYVSVGYLWIKAFNYH